MIGISHQRSVDLIEAPFVRGVLSAMDSVFSPSPISFFEGVDKLY